MNKINRLGFRCLSVLMLLAIPILTFAQEQGAKVLGEAEKLAKHQEKIAHLVQEDPDGIVLTITAVLVVFSALLMLAVVFSSLGKLMQFFQKKGEQKAEAKPKKIIKRSSSELSDEEALAVSLALSQAMGGSSDEVALAIAMALHSEFDLQHDEESYQLTIQHDNQSLWANKAQVMRQLP